MDVKSMWGRLSTWEKVAGIAGLALALSLFAPWWQLSSPLGDEEETLYLSGWEGLAFIDILVFVGGLAVAGLIAAKAAGRAPRLPVAQGAILMLIGVVCLALAGYRTAEMPAVLDTAAELSSDDAFGILEDTEEDSPFGESGTDVFGEDDSIGIPGVVEISRGEEELKPEPLFSAVAIALGGLIAFAGFKRLREDGTTPGEQLGQLRAQVAGGAGGVAAGAGDSPARGKASAEPQEHEPQPEPEKSGGAAIPPPPPPPPKSGAKPPPPPPPTAEKEPPPPPKVEQRPPPPPPQAASERPGAAAASSKPAAKPPAAAQRVDTGAVAKGSAPGATGAVGDVRPRVVPIIVGLIAVAVAGVAVWENFLRDEGTGPETAQAEAEAAGDVAPEEEAEVPLSENRFFPPSDGGSESAEGSEPATTDTGELDDATDATSPTGTGDVAGGAHADRAADGYPAEGDVAIRKGAQGVLRDFHTALVQRQFDSAWDMLTERKRKQFQREDGYAAWEQAQASLSPYLQPGGLKVELEELEGDGVARVSVTGMSWTQPGASCSEWSGVTWVRYEDGAWRYDPGFSTTPQRERAWENNYEALLGASC